MRIHYSSETKFKEENENENITEEWCLRKEFIAIDRCQQIIITIIEYDYVSLHRIRYACSSDIRS